MIKDTSFISAEQADNVEKFVFSPQMLWTLSTSSVDHDENIIQYDNSVDHYQFTHVLYSGDVPQSQLFEEFHKLFISFVQKNNIEYKSLMRMKINLVTGGSNLEGKYMPPHTDAPFDHKVFIYYINDSDGNTILFDDNKNIVESVAPEKGLGICFDGTIIHSNRFPIKNNFRCVLNVAFL